MRPPHQSRESQEDPLHFADWLTLVGFLGSASDALQTVKSQTPPKDSKTSDAEWLTLIQPALDFVNKLSDRENTTPQIRKLEPKYDDRVASLQSEPTFQEHLVGVSQWQFAWIELAKLHCFQPQLNWEYLLQQEKVAPPPGDVEALLKYSLPTKSEKRKTELLGGFNPLTSTLFVVSENLDLRVVGNAQAEDPNTGRRILGFAYDFGLPQISVVNYKGLFLIKNGYHRAFALLRAGHEYVPCLIVRTDSFQFTGAQAQGFFGIDLLTSARSPLLSDFDSAAAFLVPRRRVRVMVTVHAETQVVPV